MLLNVIARATRLSLFGIGALALVYGLVGALPAFAQDDGCGIPMVRDERTGIVHLMNQGACPQPPCVFGGQTGNCVSGEFDVEGTGGPETWQVCLCTRIVPNGQGGWNVYTAPVKCFEGFRAWGPEEPTAGMGKCLKLNCPGQCVSEWTEHPEDEEVSTLSCGCPSSP